eukprot:6172345-Pleurochrysis_carterae.AAC.3
MSRGYLEAKKIRLLCALDELITLRALVASATRARRLRGFARLSHSNSLADFVTRDKAPRAALCNFHYVDANGQQEARAMEETPEERAAKRQRLMDMIIAMEEEEGEEEDGYDDESDDDDGDDGDEAGEDDEDGEEDSPMQNSNRPVVPGIDYTTRAFSDALRLSKRQLEAVCKDCTKIFLLSSSNWLSADGVPRCLLESLALAIFHRHAQGVVYDSSLSGVEWWVQVRKHGHEDEGIEFHWDCDESVADRSGILRCPTLSTVTYLSDTGAPTMVLEDVPAPTTAGAESVEEVTGPMKSAFVSFPKKGKHLVFDGCLLHGAVPTGLERDVAALAASSTQATSSSRELPPEQQKPNRITLLANIWIDHRPKAIDALPESLLQHMAKTKETATGVDVLRESTPVGRFARGEVDARGSKSAPPDEPRCVRVTRRADASRPTLEVAFGRRTKHYAMRVALWDEHDNVSPNDDTIVLEFEQLAPPERPLADICANS